jgi:hypothetical protein
MPEKSVGDKLVDDIKNSLTLKDARDAVSNAVDKAKGALGFAPDKPAPAPKPNTAWHDDMVRKANDSFKPQPQPSKPAPQPSKPLPKYKNGTDYVPATGPAILHEGEAVLNKRDADKHRAEKWSGSVKGELGGEDTKPPKKKIREIRTRKGKNGGYIHEHHHEHPEHHPMEEHISADQLGMMQHLMQHMGSGDPGSEDASADQAGAAAQQQPQPQAAM